MLILLLAGCPKHKFAKDIDSIQQFDTFIGLHSGMDESSVRKLLGDPESTDDGSGTYWYMEWCEGEVKIGLSKESGRVGPIRVQGQAPSCLAQKGIADPRLEFIGQHVDAVADRFGPAASARSGNYEYPLTTDPLPKVTFVCPSNRDKVCWEIYVHWNPKDKP